MVESVASSWRVRFSLASSRARDRPLREEKREMRAACTLPAHA